MKFAIALVCHNFQQRLCWMLSSIVQQSCFPFDIVVDIACRRHNGVPSTESVANRFKQVGLKVRLTYVDDIDIFAKRGLVRNLQIKNAIADERNYIWFADADHVYHPETFLQLTQWLNVNGEDNHACIFSRYKAHTEVKATNRLMFDYSDKDLYVPSAFLNAISLPTIQHTDKNRLAPGNMQIVSIKDIINLSNGVYVDPDRCRDNHLFEKGQRAYSDIYFRQQIGKSIPIKLPLQIHLNHARDKEAKKHLEVQR